MNRTRDEIEGDADISDGDTSKFAMPWRLLALILEVLLDIREKQK